MKQQKETKKCPYCSGFGFWPIGDLSPLGPMDAREWGVRAVQCFYCKKGYVNTGSRYEMIKGWIEQNESKK